MNKVYNKYILKSCEDWGRVVDNKILPIGDKIIQRLEEIARTHPEITETENALVEGTQKGSVFSACVSHKGEKIADFQIFTSTKNYTDIVITVSEITYYK